MTGHPCAAGTLARRQLLAQRAAHMPSTKHQVSSCWYVQGSQLAGSRQAWREHWSACWAPLRPCKLGAAPSADVAQWDAARSACLSLLGFMSDIITTFRAVIEADGNLNSLAVVDKQMQATLGVV